jgi:hypothetical protein
MRPATPLSFAGKTLSSPVTRIVVRRPGGAVEVIGRHGHLDPAALVRNFSGGTVLAVRHEQAGKLLAAHVMTAARAR